MDQKSTGQKISGERMADQKAARPLIAFSRVSRDFDDGRIIALRDTDLVIGTGESLAIVGASGSGKTTLIMLMCGIMLPSSGSVLWQGRPVQSPEAWTTLRRRKVGIVFQDFNLFPTLTAAENVEIAMFGSALGSAERRKRVREALASVDLSARATHLPHQLSGGERQRVAIARAIINDPIVILADEPTGNLDSESGAAVMDLLLELHRARGVTLVMVTHKTEYATHCDRIIHVKDGRLAEQSSLEPSEAI